VRQKGYGVRTETADDGTQRYHLVLPEGVEEPLGHVEPAPVKTAANRRKCDPSAVCKGRAKLIT
jgi:hypothetical protein